MKTLCLKLQPLMTRNEYEQEIRRRREIGGKAKKQQTEYVAWECRAQKLPALSKITKIVFIWKHKNKRSDIDNVESSQKFIWDGLVLGGIIRNDTWRYRPSNTTHKHLVDKKHPGVEVIMDGRLQED